MKWEELPRSLDWDRRLAYFLDPANQSNISREDLQEALAILTAKYCDEFYNLRFLECFVEEQMGSERLESAIEASVASDAMLDRTEFVMKAGGVEDRMKAALKLITGIADEFDDLASEQSEHSDNDY